MGAIGGGLIGAGNIYGTHLTNQMIKDEAATSRRYNAKMQYYSPQLKLAGMEAAGVNPAVLGGSVGGAMSGAAQSGMQKGFQNPGHAIGNTIQSLGVLSQANLNVKQAQYTAQKQDNDTRSTNANIAKTEAETKRLQSEQPKKDLYGNIWSYPSRASDWIKTSPKSWWSGKGAAKHDAKKYYDKYTNFNKKWESGVYNHFKKVHNNLSGRR